MLSHRPLTLIAGFFTSRLMRPQWTKAIHQFGIYAARALFVLLFLAVAQPKVFALTDPLFPDREDKLVSSRDIIEAAAFRRTLKDDRSFHQPVSTIASQSCGDSCLTTIGCSLEHAQNRHESLVVSTFRNRSPPSNPVR